jgi:hypothetical protein
LTIGGSKLRRGPRSRAVLVQRNRGFSVATAILGLGALLALAAVPFTNHAEQGTPLSIAAYAGQAFFVTLACWLGFYRARRRDVTYGVREGVLVIDGAVSRVRFRRGEAAAMPDGRARVDLRAWPQRVRLEVEDMQTARDLLAELGLDRRAGTSRFVVKTFARWRGAETVALGLALGFLGLVFAAMMGLFGAAIVAAALGVFGAATISSALKRNVELTIGADGIEVASRHERRFAPHASIRSIERIDERGERWSERDRRVSPGFAVTLDDGTRWVFDTRAARFAANVWATDPIFEAVREARDAARPGAHRATASLERGDRTSRAWIDALRALAKHERVDYRVPALDARALFDVLADPSASREHRAAAAIALAANEEHAPKLRVAADDVADAIVRRVAVAATAHDEAELEKAIEEVAEDDDGARTRGRA